jgi:hypothetical protein
MLNLKEIESLRTATVATHAYGNAGVSYYALTDGRFLHWCPPNRTVYPREVGWALCSEPRPREREHWTTSFCRELILDGPSVAASIAIPVVN